MLLSEWGATEIGKVGEKVSRDIRQEDPDWKAEMWVTQAGGEGPSRKLPLWLPGPGARRVSPRRRVVPLVSQGGGSGRPAGKRLELTWVYRAPSLQTRTAWTGTEDSAFQTDPHVREKRLIPSSLTASSVSSSRQDVHVITVTVLVSAIQLDLRPSPPQAGPASLDWLQKGNHQPLVWLLKCGNQFL